MNTDTTHHWLRFHNFVAMIIMMSVVLCSTAQEFSGCSTGSHNCDASAECIDDNGVKGSFVCRCINGYTENGTAGYCQDVLECEQDSHGCHENATCSNSDGSYSCICNNGFYGDGLECNDIDECVENIHTCALMANCINIPGSYQCQCHDGYHGDGLECNDTDECTESIHSCALMANCINMPGSYQCHCHDGYHGDGFMTCMDDNECVLSMHSCHGNANCVNLMGSFDCICNDGFSGDGTMCSDDNECLNEAHDCSIHAICNNTMGWYSCTCNRGYHGDGFSCSDVNECLLLPCQHAGNCTNTDGSFQCACLSGYSGNHCQTNIDDCLSLPCSQNAQCLDEVNGYRCLCQPGLEGEHCEVNINECNSDPCLHGTCQDMVNSYLCHCTTGFTGVHCESDVDNCLSQPCQNDGRCIGNVSHYHCICPTGYFGKNCDVTKRHCLGLECVNGGTCSDTINGYVCKCAVGYTGDQCESDINECSVPTLGTPCHYNATCLDLIGQNSCQCKPGFHGDGVSCSDTDECTTQQHNCDPNSDCLNTIGSYKCHCRHGYRDVHANGRLCRDENECRSSLRFTATDCDVPERAHCVNIKGSYQCRCKDGFHDLGTARRGQCLVPAQLVNTLTRLAVHVGENIFVPCQIIGYPFPNHTSVLFQRRDNCTCQPHDSCGRDVSQHWTEKPSPLAGIPSGTLSLEKERISQKDNNSVVTCQVKSWNGSQVTHAISLLVFDRRHFQLSITTNSEITVAILRRELVERILLGLNAFLSDVGRLGMSSGPPTYTAKVVIPVNTLRRELRLTTLRAGVSNSLVSHLRQKASSSHIISQLSARSTDVCDRDTTPDFKGRITWPDTHVGYTHIAACPVRVSGSEGTRAQRTCTFDDNGYPQWSRPDTTQCAFESAISRRLHDLEQVNFTTSRDLIDIIGIQETAQKVENLTKLANQLSTADVEYATKILNRLANALRNSTHILEESDVEKAIRISILNSVNQLINVRQDIMSRSRVGKQLPASLRLIRTLEVLVQSLLVSPKSVMVNATSNVAIGGLCPNKSTGALFYVLGGKNRKDKENETDGTQFFRLTQSNRIPPIDDLLVAFLIPSPTLQMAAAKQRQQSDQIPQSSLCPMPTAQFIYYRDANIFLGRSAETSGNITVASGVIASQLGSIAEINNLPSPVEIIFEVKRELLADHDVGCYFWNTKQNNSENMKWSQDGCKMVGDRQPTTRGFRYTCHCNHMTHFAMILVSSSQMEPKPKGLSEVTYVGCSLSILGLLITIALTAKRKSRIMSHTLQDRAQHQQVDHLNILLGLCVSLLLSQLVFIANLQISLLAVKSGNICRVLGLFLHYFLLQSFVWMAAEAVNVYFKLVRGLNGEPDFNISKVALVSAITLPAVIIAIAMASSGGDVYKHMSYCWIQSSERTYLMASFFAPLAVLVLINVAVLVPTLFHISRFLKHPENSKKYTQQKGNKKRAVVMVRATLSLSVLVGFTWAIGLFLLVDKSDGLQYIFVVLNSTQGFFIFLFHASIAQNSSNEKLPHRQSMKQSSVASVLWKKLKKPRRVSTALQSVSDGKDQTLSRGKGAEDHGHLALSGPCPVGQRYLCGEQREMTYLSTHRFCLKENPRGTTLHEKSCLKVEYMRPSDLQSGQNADKTLGIKRYISWPHQLEKLDSCHHECLRDSRKLHGAARFSWPLPAEACNLSDQS